jgi:hypothetical protein
LLGAVDQLVGTFRPNREEYDGTLLELALVPWRAERRPPAQDDEELLGSVVEVVEPARCSRGDLVEARADPVATRQPSRATGRPLLLALELPRVPPDVRRLGQRALM